MSVAVAKPPTLDVSLAGKLEALVNCSGSGRSAEKPVRPQLSVRQLLTAKKAQPVQSLAELAAGTFGSDQELWDFLAFTYAERRRGLTDCSGSDSSAGLE
jgi:hypothetical protein